MKSVQMSCSGECLCVCHCSMHKDSITPRNEQENRYCHRAACHAHCFDVALAPRLEKAPHTSHIASAGLHRGSKVATRFQVSQGSPVTNLIDGHSPQGIAKKQKQICDVLEWFAYHAILLMHLHLKQSPIFGYLSHVRYRMISIDIVHVAFRCFCLTNLQYLDPTYIQLQHASTKASLPGKTQVHKCFPHGAGLIATVLASLGICEARLGQVPEELLPQLGLRNSKHWAIAWLRT